MGDAKNLQGGTLLVTTAFRRGRPDLCPWPRARSPSAASPPKGEGASVTRGVPTSGRISNGGIVEKDTGFKLSSLTNLKLSLHNPDLTTATRIAKAVNAYLGGNSAQASDPFQCRTDDSRQLSGGVMALLTDIEQVKVDPDQGAKVSHRRDQRRES
jgi:flagellar P-ring protein precursor FlgI